jgi:hypothetical protein
MEGKNGDKYWYKNSQLHRSDGPAKNLLMEINIGIKIVNYIV